MSINGWVALQRGQLLALDGEICCGLPLVEAPVGWKRVWPKRACAGGVDCEGIYDLVEDLLRPFFLLLAPCNMNYPIISHRTKKGDGERRGKTLYSPLKSQGGDAEHLPSKNPFKRKCQVTSGRSKATLKARKLASAGCSSK